MGIALHAPLHRRRRVGKLGKVELVIQLKKRGLTNREIAEIVGDNPRILEKEFSEEVLVPLAPVA